MMWTQPLRVCRRCSTRFSEAYKRGRLWAPPDGLRSGHAGLGAMPQTPVRFCSHVALFSAKTQLHQRLADGFDAIKRIERCGACVAEQGI